VPHIGSRQEAETPFALPSVVSFPGWHERALWWEEGRVLAVADALGTRPYFVRPGDELGVHPFLRLTPPKKLGAYAPEHILVGHGKGVHGDGARAALRQGARHFPTRPARRVRERDPRRAPVSIAEDLTALLGAGRVADGESVLDQHAGDLTYHRPHGRTRSSSRSRPRTSRACSSGPTASACPSCRTGRRPASRAT
jgi:hypothetical protein